jgi:hypothetical protein
VSEINPLVTFEEAEREHLRRGIQATAKEALEWVEDSGEFAKFARENLFAQGKPAIGLDGTVVWSEEEYWGYPEKERADP